MDRALKFYKLSIGLAILALVVLTGCQAVFTYSPLAAFQRDLTDLTEEQQATYAETALSSGDTEAIAEAYETIAETLASQDEPDPALSVLAAELAFGASGVTDVFTEILADPEALAVGGAESLDEVLENLDLDLISEGAEHLVNAAEAEDGEVEITDTQYAIAGAVLIAGAAEEAGGFENLESLEPGDAGYEEYQDAQEFLELGGVEDLLSFS